MTNKYLVYISLLIVGLIGLLGAGIVYAQAVAGDSIYPPIVQRLVERFNLDADEVQQVFDEARQGKQENMQARCEQRLDQAVAQGALTQEQKEALLVKKAEMQADWIELKDLSPEERRAKMQEMREEMRTWLEENNIELKSMFGFGCGLAQGIGRPHRGFGRGFGPGAFQ